MMFMVFHAPKQHRRRLAIIFGGLLAIGLGMAVALGVF